MSITNTLYDYMQNLKHKSLNRNSIFNLYSFESSLTFCSTLKNKYTNVIIKCDNTDNFEINLYNEDGIALFSKSTNLNQETKAIAIPLNNITSGAYLVKVSTMRESITMPFEL